VYLTWTTLSFSGWQTLELIEETILPKARPEGHQSEVIRLLAVTNSVDFDISLYDVKRSFRRNNAMSSDWTAKHSEVLSDSIENLWWSLGGSNS
jgi:hypothetical protein